MCNLLLWYRICLMMPTSSWLFPLLLVVCLCCVQTRYTTTVKYCPHNLGSGPFTCCKDFHYCFLFAAQSLNASLFFELSLLLYQAESPFHECFLRSIMHLQLTFVMWIPMFTGCSQLRVHLLWMNLRLHQKAGQYLELIVQLSACDPKGYWVGNTSLKQKLEVLVKKRGLKWALILPLGLRSPDFPKSKITVELDTAHAAWVSHDVALLSTKTGNLLLLSLVYDGRCGGNPSYPVLFVTYVHCFCDQKQD